MNIIHACFFSTAYSVATGDASKQHIQNEKRQIDFDEWSTIDEKVCSMFIQVNKYWKRLVTYMLFYNNCPQDAVAFFEKNTIVTGSAVECSVICRALITKKFDIELDDLHCMGQISEDVASNVLSSVTDHPGFFQVKPIIYQSVFPFLKEEQTFVCLSPFADNIDNVANLFLDVFDEQNEFLPTETLKRVIGRLAVQGNKNAKNIIYSGPSSATYQTVNESGIALVIAALTKLLQVEHRTYNPVSVNDIIILDSDNIISHSEDLESLYSRAFPPNSNSVDFFYLKHLVSKLRSEKSEIYVMRIFNLIKAKGYIPYANIMEFGDFYFDHVPCFHLTFWPKLALEWSQRQLRYWPDSEIVQKIISEGCHIVPKSPRGENNNEWRISFSSAEMTLSNTLSPFQRKCYLVGKSIYYAVIKEIDSDIFASYFIKTVMFKLLERQPSCYWEKTSLIEVVQDLFKDLSACFKRKVLTSFFTEDMNLLYRIDHDKLEYASMEAGAVAKYPLAFLPKDYNKRITLIKKTVLFGEIFRDCLATLYNFREHLGASFYGQCNLIEQNESLDFNSQKYIINQWFENIEIC